MGVYSARARYSPSRTETILAVDAKHAGLHMRWLRLKARRAVERNVGEVAARTQRVDQNLSRRKVTRFAVFVKVPHEILDFLTHFEL